ncbi:extracellular solute-binding protein [Pseudomonas sp. 21LCFQ02]|uniref:extracellular solute-binding protein n=1 Tax=Pseudomonas sp. 21LCFQ02 TaxID=2957505 RepID=UPI00209B66E8|nr:extracellular solute-binding protein [Pseudomonas sp. 21LCFQ02]MCO8170954.1 extracellular solute-binding protein [Pseudomonas sp. 21LCFQ02]
MFKRLLYCTALVLSGASLLHAQPQHYLTVYGEPPKYGKDFEHFDFVEPDAPKGGRLTQSTYMVPFDHLIPYVDKGQGVDKLDGWLYAPLAYRAKDEPYTVYGYVAQTMELAPDRTWVRFNIDPRAKFDDGQPITAEDVRYTFEQLMSVGKLQYRLLFANVRNVTVEAPRQVRFDFNNGQDRTLALDLASLPVLPAHWWRERDLANGAGFEIPPGSGPYRVTAVDPRRTVHLERVKNWWGADLPVSRGLYNFDQLSIEYFANSGSGVVQAFRSGAFDLQPVSSAAQHATAYQGEAQQDGRLQRGYLMPGAVQKAQGFFFNLDKPQFADRRVRQALALLWDFEWTNRSLMYDAYRRQRSFFSNTPLAASGLPSPGELKVLQPWRDQLPAEVFGPAFEPPVTDGSGMLRDKQLQALALLESAGWRPRGEQLVNAAGQPLRFTFLTTGSMFGRLVMPYKRNLKQIGVTLDFRTVDSAQYVNRLRDRDYDMIMASYPVSASPGRELLNYFGSEAARDPGSNNYMALHDPMIDQLLDGVINAGSREAMQDNARALDRVLQWGYYWVPNFYPPGSPVVWWNRFGRPSAASIFEPGADAWWQLSSEPLTNAQMQAVQPTATAKEHSHAGL